MYLEQSIVIFRFSEKVKFPGRIVTSKFKGICYRLRPYLSQESFDLCGLSYSARMGLARCMGNAVPRPRLWFAMSLDGYNSLLIYFLTFRVQHDLIAKKALPIYAGTTSKCHLVVLQINLVSTEKGR